MPTSQETWTELYRRLYPKGRLSPQELKAYYVDAPYSPFQKMWQELNNWLRAQRAGGFGELPPKMLFCGARGSGKSVLLQRLGQQAMQGWHVVVMDIAPVLPGRGITSIQVVANIGLALLAELCVWAGEKNADALLAGFEPAREFESALLAFSNQVGSVASLVHSLLPLLLISGGVSPDVGAAASGGVKAFGASVTTAAALTSRLAPLRSLNQRVADFQQQAGDGHPASRRLVESVNQIAEHLSNKAGRPLLVGVDGLDRLATASDALVAFEDAGLFSSLSMALVLSGPTALRHHPRFAGLRSEMHCHLLFNFPVVQRDGNDNPAGVDSMARLAQARLGDLHALVSPEALALAIRMSSGLPVELLNFLSKALGLAEDEGAERVERDHVSRQVHDLRLTLQQSLFRDDYTELRSLLDAGQVDSTDRAMELMYNNIVVCYPNDSIWFRPHEALVPGLMAQRGV